MARLKAGDRIVYVGPLFYLEGSTGTITKRQNWFSAGGFKYDVRFDRHPDLPPMPVRKNEVVRKYA